MGSSQSAPYSALVFQPEGPRQDLDRSGESDLTLMKSNLVYHCLETNIISVKGEIGKFLPGEYCLYNLRKDGLEILPEQLPQ